MTPQERAEAHWDCYVGPLQKTMLIQMVETCMAISRFHYVTSHVHGAKHQEQDARETARAAFTPVQEKIDISDMPNGSVVYSPVQGPCAKCATGECTEHKEIAAKLAGTCEDRVQDDNACPVCGEQMIGKPRGCGKHGFTSIPAPVQEKIDLSLPSITVTGTEDECRQKHHEELTEMKNELAGSTKFFIEAWDVLQAARTWQERCDPVFAGGASMAVHQAEKLLASFTDYNKIRHAKTLALIKNAERFYYAPEVCKVILETNGQRWNPQG